MGLEERLQSCKNVRFGAKRKPPQRLTPRKKYPYRKIFGDVWIKDALQKIKSVNAGHKIKLSRHELAFKDYVDKKEKFGIDDLSAVTYRLALRDYLRRQSVRKYQNANKDKMKGYRDKYYKKEGTKKRNNQQYYIHLYDTSIDTSKMNNEEIEMLYLKIKEENKQARLIK